MHACKGVGGCGGVVGVEEGIASGTHEFEEVFHPHRLDFTDLLCVFWGIGGHS